ncbi:MAG: metallophosphoesterase [Clostridiales Family XIII bacterium]|jgi:predicted phosphohydrolase|nr:metallophosphoesterase [Clostridiales Family XIII bacterium]
MGRIWAIGDLHLSFSSEKPMWVFGDIWKDHDEKIKESCEKCVGAEDVLLILGDISWALKTADADADLTWVSALPGRKVLLRGNHDLWWTSVSKLRARYPGLSFLQNDCLLVGNAGEAADASDEAADASGEAAGAVDADARVVLCGSRGWVLPNDQNYAPETDEKIYLRELARMKLSLQAARRTGAGRIIVCIHFPPAVNGARSGFTDLFEEYGVSKVVYGHLHGKDAWKKGIKGTLNGVEYILAAADYTNFTPILVTTY